MGISTIEPSGGTECYIRKQWYGGTDDFTFSAYITLSAEAATGNHHTVLGRSINGDGSDGFQLNIKVQDSPDSPLLYLGIWGFVGWSNLEASSPLPLGKRLHICLVRESKTFKLYVNGTLSGTRTTNNVWNDAPGSFNPPLPLTIGGVASTSTGRAFTTGVFQGKIDGA